jgi:GTP-binding protein HflX
VVFNKVDLIEPGEARRLVIGRKDAVTTSAPDRESTRVLLAMIASRLQERWKQASLSPYAAQETSEDGETEIVGAATDVENTSLTTLEEMLGHKRYRRSTVRA